MNPLALQLAAQNSALSYGTIRNGYRAAQIAAALARNRAIRYGASALVRAWRRRRGRVAIRVSRPVLRRRSRNNRFGGPRPAARNKQYTTTGTLPLDTLDGQDITSYIARGTENDQRKYNYVDLIGFKQCIQVENPSSTAPVVYHMALIQLRSVPLGSINDTLTEEFFTAPNDVDGTETGKSGINFDNGSLTKCMKNCLNINSKKWRVFYHIRKLVSPRNVSANPGTMMDFMGNCRIDRYAKLKQRIQFEGNAGGNAYRPIYVVQWYEPHRIQDNANAAFGGMPFERLQKTYFKPQ